MKCCHIYAEEKVGSRLLVHEAFTKAGWKGLLYAVLSLQINILFTCFECWSLMLQKNKLTIIPKLIRSVTFVLPHKEKEEEEESIRDWRGKQGNRKMEKLTSIFLSMFMLSMVVPDTPFSGCLWMLCKDHHGGMWFSSWKLQELLTRSHVCVCLYMYMYVCIHTNMNMQNCSY